MCVQTDAGILGDAAAAEAGADSDDEEAGGVRLSQVRTQVGPACLIAGSGIPRNTPGNDGLFHAGGPDCPTLLLCRRCAPASSTRRRRRCRRLASMPRTPAPPSCRSQRRLCSFARRWPVPPPTTPLLPAPTAAAVSALSCRLHRKSLRLTWPLLSGQLQCRLCAPAFRSIASVQSAVLIALHRIAM